VKRALHSILYVDDEPDIREIVRLALGLDPSLAIECCGSGSEALAQLARVQPDLVMLDVMMPQMDGPAVLARMQAEPQLRELPVVFMTAKTLPAEVERFRALGALGVIAKPFDPMRLSQQVQKLWHGAADGGR
jgi:two-component system, OmpR family, response regulator